MGAGLGGAMGAGCRLWGLLPSWVPKDWSQAAQVAVTGRWFQSLILIVILIVILIHVVIFIVILILVIVIVIVIL